MHPRAFQHLSRARGPQSTRARGGDREVMTCQALVQSWFLFRVSNSQLSFSCVSEALFFLIRSREDLLNPNFYPLKQNAFFVRVFLSSLLFPALERGIREKKE